MDEDYKELELNGVELRVFKDGTIMRYIKQTRCGYRMGWNICELCPHKYQGYIRIMLKNKSYRVHRIIAMVYLGLDLNNKNQQIDHIDRCKTNNNVNNLRIVTNSENQFNISHKGCSFHKRINKWQSYITFNKQRWPLGYFDTEEEAHNKYLEAKAKHHIINPHPPQL